MKIFILTLGAVFYKTQLFRLSVSVVLSIEMHSRSELFLYLWAAIAKLKYFIRCTKKISLFHENELIYCRLLCMHLHTQLIYVDAEMHMCSSKQPRPQKESHLIVRVIKTRNSHYDTNIFFFFYWTEWPLCILLERATHN